MQYSGKDDDDEQKGKPGRKEFKEDVEDSISKAIKKSKPKRKPKKKATKAKSGKGKYAGMSSSELYQLVKQKRNQILSRRGIPEKLPRGKAALISICKRVKA